MPLVRIDLPDSISADQALRIGEAINAVMESVLNVPPGDKFQIIARHARESRNLTKAYLGIDYTEGLVIVQLTLNQGRSIELKRAFYAQVADSLQQLGIRRQDVFISLVEVPRENWSFGNGEMQYAPAVQ
jgi:phenylpyruvate tautomerase PptA (4-oxalocrotonate tautomerase family)